MVVKAAQYPGRGIVARATPWRDDESLLLDDCGDGRLLGSPLSRPALPSTRTAYPHNRCKHLGASGSVLIQWLSPPCRCPLHYSSVSPLTRLPKGEKGGLGSARLQHTVQAAVQAHCITAPVLFLSSASPPLYSMASQILRLLPTVSGSQTSAATAK